MPQILQFWFALDMRRRITVVAATVAMFVAILVMSRIAATPSMALLYAGLDPASAGAVVSELQAQGVDHDIRGEAIFVPEGDRDRVRLALAAQGLPAQGMAGYELLDSVTGFGTTAQMFDATWTRAVEGELARTILANPQIKAARVHLARGSDRPFATSTEPTASVLVTAVGGLTGDQARALRHLVSAAVTGLRPDRVEVIDSTTGLIPLEGPGSSGDETRQAERLRGNIQRLLEARVGTGKAVVEVAVELATERELLSERRLDPQGRVAVTTESETTSGTETRSDGAVTVASNLPDGDAAGGDGPSSQSNESRESTSYEVSETRREVTRVPGDIRRLSVAVIVDGQTVTAEDGTESWQPRSDEELAALRELVVSAAGIDESRGDSLALKSMQLEPVPTAELADGTGLAIDATRLAGLALLAAVILAVGLFVLRPAFRSATRGTGDVPLQLPSSEASGGPVLTGEIADGFDLPDFSRNIMDPSDIPEDPVARLRRQIEERQAEAIEILRNWMDAGKERG